MPARSILSLASTAVLFSVLVACGSDAPSTFGPDHLSGRSAGGGNDTLGGKDDGTSSTGGGGVTDACATSTAGADKLPLHMVVVLDNSGSMCEYTPNQSPRDCSNAGSKWQQVTKALDAFFASPQSTGISVSLIAFPQDNGTCDASTYATPIAADVPLPDTAGTLSAKIAGIDPNGSTPTRPALEGALNYAKTVNTQLAGKGKVALVMATDGYPENCDDNSIASASQIASDAKATIPTYVIGVGKLLDDLNALASAGGTDKAYIVSTTNQSTVANDFATALAQIRGASLSCEYALPQPPQGETLDLGKVNVQYTGGGGAAQTLTYSAGCASTDGWRYDDANDPTKIVLCPATCDKAKADTSAKVDLVLGCQTKGTVVK